MMEEIMAAQEAKWNERVDASEAFWRTMDADRQRLDEMQW